VKSAVSATGVEEPGIYVCSPFSVYELEVRLMRTPGRPSEVHNSDGIVDVKEQRRRQSSVWSTISSNGERRRASIVTAAAVILGRCSSTEDEEVETKGEE